MGLGPHEHRDEGLSRRARQYEAAEAAVRTARLLMELRS